MQQNGSTLRSRLLAALDRNEPLDALISEVNDHQPKIDPKEQLKAALEADATANPNAANDPTQWSGSVHTALSELAAPAKPSLRATHAWEGDIPPRQWLIDGWLAAGRALLFTGEGGRGKSWLSLQLAAKMAIGGGHWIAPQQGADAPPEVADGAVVMASWEDEAEEVARRLRGLNTDRAALKGRLHHLDLTGQGPLWGPRREGSQHIDTVGELTDLGQAVRSYAKQHDGRLLIIDPLAAAYGQNENARPLVRAFVSSWDEWAKETGCAVMLIAHPPKTTASYAGSTDWRNAVRGMWALEKEGREENGQDDPNAPLILKCDKASYGRAPAPMRLTRTESGTFVLYDDPKVKKETITSEGDNDYASLPY